MLNLNLLKISVVGPASLTVTVADEISRHLSLSANAAYSGHFCHLQIFRTFAIIQLKILYGNSLNIINLHYFLPQCIIFKNKGEKRIVWL
jgi:hypothetical protein